MTKRTRKRQRTQGECPGSPALEQVLSPLVDGMTATRDSLLTWVHACGVAALDAVFREQAAAVIHNSIVFEQTHEASLTDPLTTLPNTRFMVNHLGRELSRAERGNAEVSLLVMDLNDFKDINDTFGHHVGDRALRGVAQVLRGAIRPYDVCVRYAGDEFIVVLAGCGWDEAEYKRLELQEAVESLVFEAKPGVRMPLSISAGAAVFPHDGNAYEVLMAKADRRMYRNKVMYKRDVQARAASHSPAASDNRAVS